VRGTKKQPRRPNGENSTMDCRKRLHAIGGDNQVAQKRSKHLYKQSPAFFLRPAPPEGADVDGASTQKKNPGVNDEFPSPGKRQTRERGGKEPVKQFSAMKKKAAGKGEKIMGKQKCRDRARWARAEYPF